MLTFAQFGAGRIGAIHAANLTANPATRLKYIVDVDAGAAQTLASKTGATVGTRDAVFADATVGAVIIASSTDTHAELAIAAARAGKAIFCEKPIDLSLTRVDECLAAVKSGRRSDAGRLQPPLRSELRRSQIAASTPEPSAPSSRSSSPAVIRVCRPLLISRSPAVSSAT